MRLDLGVISILKACGGAIRRRALKAGSAFEFSSPRKPLIPAVTDGNIVVLLADFYRQGDGNIESFTAHMFVSEVDEAPDLPGFQNVRIEDVGYGHAIANFN